MPWIQFHAWKRWEEEFGAPEDRDRIFGARDLDEEKNGSGNNDEDVQQRGRRLIERRKGFAALLSKNTMHSDDSQNTMYLCDSQRS